jgi:hypothetical protein
LAWLLGEHFKNLCAKGAAFVAPFLLFTDNFYIIKNKNFMEKNMSGTFRFSFDADYDQDKTNPQDTLPNISYEFQTANSTLDDVTTKDIQFHFNAFLRSLGYVIDYDDDSNYTINDQLNFDDDLVDDNVLNIGDYE